MVRRVREVLSLQREAVALTVCRSASADMGTVQEVAAIELQPWLVCEHLQYAPAPGVGKASGPA